MVRYYKFSRKQFEYELKGILIRNKLGFLQDITQEWLNDGNYSWERIYKISTKNKSVDIIIFSSIDIDSDKVRENGNDRVRVVLRWKTKNGNVFKKVHHHNRLKTLFNNLEYTLQNIQLQIFNLNYKEFSKEVV